MTQLGVLLLFVVAILMALFALHYITDTEENFKPILPRATDFMAKKGILAYHPVWISFFRLHIVGGAIGIVLGAWQFFFSFRCRYKRLHRIVGSSYAVAILVSSVAGLYLCYFALVSIMGIIGFYLANLLWLGSTVLAIQAVLCRVIYRHRRWFIRSYAFTAELPPAYLSA